MDTNNSAEALNKSLKYSYLPKRRSMTLSAAATLLVDFLPKCRKTFNQVCIGPTEISSPNICEIILETSSYTALTDRLQFKEDDIEDVDTTNGEFKVAKGSELLTLVTNQPSCSCPDLETFHLPWKHIFAIFRLQSTWTWYNLPKSYLESAWTIRATTNSSCHRQWLYHYYWRWLQWKLSGWNPSQKGDHNYTLCE